MAKKKALGGRVQQTVDSIFKQRYKQPGRVADFGGHTVWNVYISAYAGRIPEWIGRAGLDWFKNRYRVEARASVQFWKIVTVDRSWDFRNSEMKNRALVG